MTTTIPTTTDTWMVCSVCRQDLAFGGKYWECSVSTCNRNRTRLVFCSVACWDAHLATARHREAWAVEAVAPSREAWAAEQAGAVAESELALATTARMPSVPAAVSTTASSTSGGDSGHTSGASASTSASSGASSGASPSTAPAGSPSPSGPGAARSGDEDEILVVVSKMKKYIKDRSGMNTSDAVAAAISEHIRAVCDVAVRNAGAAGRKTVLDRDVPKAR